MHIEMNARILGADARIVTEGPLLAVVPRQEPKPGVARQIELFLVVYDQRADKTEVHPVSWAVAGALASDLVERLMFRVYPAPAPADAA